MMMKLDISAIVRLLKLHSLSVRNSHVNVLITSTIVSPHHSSWSCIIHLIHCEPSSQLMKLHYTSYPLWALITAHEVALYILSIVSPHHSSWSCIIHLIHCEPSSQLMKLHYTSYPLWALITAHEVCIIHLIHCEPLWNCTSHPLWAPVKLHIFIYPCNYWSVQYVHVSQLT